ncbi:universal stress protein [Haloprofundus halobius]|uniref:universal stress protein n=1 Tax=Haloprofundus halobius TaxID=2876194 RepID=UPI001CCADD45|nr:universal stress protein [Haloprofundus halobius]
MYDTILVPTDGSEAAATALEHALLMAQATDAAVHVLYVVDSEPDDAPVEENGDVQRRDTLYQYGQRTLEAAAERADELVGGGGAQMVRVETELQVGAPYEAILSYVDEKRVDLVVMGTHGRTGLQRYLLGSVAERVVRLADCPVMAVHEDDAEPAAYERILVPTDGSDCAEAAAEHAVAVARAFDAEVHALSVVNLVEEGGLFSAGGVDSAFVRRLDQRGQADADVVVEHAREAGVRAESGVVHGVPHEEIGTYATENDIDLIAIGTHGRSGLRRYLLGSVTERVLRTVPVPILAVRHRPEA